MKGILDGKRLSEKIQVELKPRIEMLVADKIRPGLGVILVGDNVESETYVNMKYKTCLKLGIMSKIHRFSKEVDETLVIETIERMNQNSMVHGILVQLPLPEHFNTNKILNTITALEKIIKV